jgi:hypothetical protein
MGLDADIPGMSVVAPVGLLVASAAFTNIEDSGNKHQVRNAV